MERDSNVLPGDYSAQSYMEALTEGVLAYWRRSQLFIQDGLGIYRAHVVRSFHQEHHINTID